MLLPVAKPGSFCGRACPKMISKDIHQGRIRQARHGDHQPPLDDGPISVRQHTRQIRRVQSALQQLRRAIGAPDGGSALQASRETWDSVLSCRGYATPFSRYCENTFGLSIPQTLGPEALPLLELLFQQLKSEETHWLSRLQALKTHTYKTRMQKDWKSGGRLHHLAIKPPPKPEIAILEIPYPLQILRRRHAKAGPFWVTALQDVPEGVVYVQFNNSHRTILEVNGRNIKLDGPILATSATVLTTALKPTSRLQDLHDMATSYWSGFWDSEDRTDLDKLDALLNHAPAIPAFAPSISLQEIKDALKKSKPNKARGPDCWSVAELRLMPDPFLCGLGALFNLILEKGEWPDPVLWASVSMLSKTDETFEIQQTRPITVLSAFYRLWAKIIARKFLDHVRQWLPDSVQGNRTQSSSRWLSSHLQLQVEKGLCDGSAFHILSLDLTKAYNLLSRSLLQRTSGVVGIPPEVSTAYHSFLGGLRRSFKVLSGSSEPVLSTVGVPEGCAFAVYSMLQLNWLASIEVDRIQDTQATTVFLNYVDNWIFHDTVSSSLKQTVTQIHDLSTWANFRISPGKTWGSSTIPATRKDMSTWSFQGGSVSVFEHKVELGMLFRFTRRLSTQDLHERWDEGLLRIDRLLHHHWHFETKIHVVNRGVFPQLFAGCESVHISLSVFKKVRGRLNSAILGPSTRSSHILSPILASKTAYEPFLYIFRTRLSSIRATIMAFQEDLEDLWNSFRDIDFQAHQTKILGPLEYFLWGCNVLGWQAQDYLQIKTSQGVTLHVILSPLDMWHDCMTQDWFAFAMTKARIPQPFRPFHIPVKTWHSSASKDWHNKHPLALRYRTFGILSGSALAKINQEAVQKCEFCGSPDVGHLHLVTECEATASIRNKPEFSSLHAVNLFTKCTGVPAQNQDVQVSQTVPNHSWPQSDPDIMYHTFTDGSASPPDMPQVRLSSWGMVWTSDFMSPPQGKLHGITPGPFHTIARAETYAVLQAIRLHTKVTLYVDNQGVVSNLNRILREGYHPMNWRSTPNNDLWALISQCVVTRPFSSILVKKVKSHLRIGDHMTPHEQWLTKGNDAADEVAKEALHLFTVSKFHANPRWKPMVEKRMIEEARLATTFLHEISHHLFSLRSRQETPRLESDVPHGPQLHIDPLSCSLFPFPFPLEFPQIKWDQKWLQLVGAYFAQLRWPGPNAPPSEVSCLELMLDLMIHYQVTLPINTTYMRKSGGTSRIIWDRDNTSFYLPSRREAMALLDRLLTELSRIWLATLEFLSGTVSMTPIPRSSSRSLRHFAYNNCVPSFAIRPVLLAGHRVQTLLASTIRPRSRTLKFRVSIPRMIPGDLPPRFPADF